MGWVFSAFTIAYGFIRNSTSGWLGDTIGPRSVLDANCVVVSAFTDGDRRGLELRIVAGVALFYLEQ